MTNILIPSMGSSMFFKDSYFPKPLIEVGGVTMLERVVQNLSTVHDGHMIFVYKDSECRKFHLDMSARLLTQYKAEIITLDEETGGGLCTALMAVDYVNNTEPLIITNADQVIDVDYRKIQDFFETENADGGVISFKSIHPRWSYLSEENGVIVEVAEKRPLSMHAMTGFFWYRHGYDFVEAAESAILKQSETNGQYYVSATLNELNLKGKKLVFYEVPENAYHSFYSPDKIREYERCLCIGGMGYEDGKIG